MAEASDFLEDATLYNEIYSSLSSYVHPGIEEEFNHFNFEDGFVIHPIKNSTSASVIAVMMNALFFDEVTKISSMTTLVRKELNFHLKKTKEYILHIDKNMPFTYKTKIYNALLPRVHLIKSI